MRVNTLMRVALLGVMMVAIGLFVMSPVANAYSISVGDQIKLSQGIGNANSGGSFKVDKVGDSLGALFDTFCVERNEYFSYNTPYYVGSISSGAVNGGYSGGNPDTISSQTAYLYYRWATGLIEHNKDNANALQLAIWSLEGEMAQYPIALTQAAQDFIDSAANASGFYGVQVMNLYGSYSADRGYYNPAQSQLIYNPVPEPATMLLLGIGLTGIAFARRRFKK